MRANKLHLDLRREPQNAFRHLQKIVHISPVKPASNLIKFTATFRVIPDTTNHIFIAYFPAFHSDTTRPVLSSLIRDTKSWIIYSPERTDGLTLRVERDAERR